MTQSIRKKTVNVISVLITKQVQYQSTSELYPVKVVSGASKYLM